MQRADKLDYIWAAVIQCAQRGSRVRSELKLNQVSWHHVGWPRPGAYLVHTVCRRNPDPEISETKAYSDHSHRHRPRYSHHREESSWLFYTELYICLYGWKWIDYYD